MIPLKTIQKAALRFKAIGIRGALVGTAGLALHGYNIEPSDVDFLVERIDGLALPKIDQSSDDSSEAAVVVDGVTVHYIDARANRRDRLWALDGDLVELHGIPVARVEDIIGLKRQCNREKDRLFLACWDARSSK